MKLKLNELWGKIKEKYENLRTLLSPYQKNLIQPLLKIIGIIIVCAVLAHLISGNETLLEYAQKNPMP